MRRSRSSDDHAQPPAPAPSGAGGDGHPPGRVAVVGDFDPRNRSHTAIEEALRHAGFAGAVEWIATDAVERPAGAQIERYDGVWIAPASPYRSMEGALEAVRAARERGLPLVGT
jgi:CTP synthase (UTP-ammonia lyase)